MTTKVYEWGKRVGGADPGGLPVAPAEAMYGLPDPITGTLIGGGVDVIIPFVAATKSIQVINTHDSGSFSFSLDGGATWIVIGAYGQIKENAEVTSIMLRPSANASSYAIIAILIA
jgi:hypothetical protein